MKIQKEDVFKALETITVAGEGKNMVESGAIQNVITFADEVIVDITITSAALHIKKRAKDSFNEEVLLSEKTILPCIAIIVRST